jgi:hypothetical protein
MDEVIKQAKANLQALKELDKKVDEFQVSVKALNTPAKEFDEVKAYANSDNLDEFHKNLAKRKGSPLTEDEEEQATAVYYELNSKFEDR